MDGAKKKSIKPIKKQGYSSPTEVSKPYPHWPNKPLMLGKFIESDIEEEPLSDAYIKEISGNDINKQMDSIEEQLKKVLSGFIGDNNNFDDPMTFSVDINTELDLQKMELYISFSNVIIDRLKIDLTKFIPQFEAKFSSHKWHPIETIPKIDVVLLNTRYGVALGFYDPEKDNYFELPTVAESDGRNRELYHHEVFSWAPLPKTELTTKEEAKPTSEIEEIVSLLDI